VPDLLSSRGVSPLALDASEIADWDRICLYTTGLQSPFFSPHFARAVASVRPDVKVCVIRKAGQAVAFLPYQYTEPWGRLLASAKPVGDPLNDYFGLIAEADVRIGARNLLELAGLCHLGFTNLDEDQLTVGLDGEQPEVALRIQLPEDGRSHWDQLRNGKGRFVKDTERCRRKLEATHGSMRFRFAGMEGGELERLIERKRLQYMATNAPDSLAYEWRRKLLRVLAAQQESTCSGVLSVLYAGDTWVASHFGIRSRRVLHYWFPVYNPELREFAPGRLLMKYMCEAAGAEGIRCIDLGGGDSQAKRDVGNERHLFYRGAWFQPGPRAVLVRGANSLRWRVEALSKKKQVRGAAHEIPVEVQKGHESSVA